MNNYEKLKLLSLNDMALQLTAFSVALLKQVADNLNGLIGAETPPFPESGEKEICKSFKQWLKEE